MSSPPAAAPPVKAAIPAPTPPAFSSRGWRIAIAVIVLLLMAVGAVGYYLFFLRGYVFTDDARLAGKLVDVSPDGTGRITDVRASAGQFVHQGDVLFTLQADVEEAELATAEATVRQAEAAVRQAEAAVHQAETAVASAQAGMTVSEAQYTKAVNGNRPEEIAAAALTVKRLEDSEALAKAVLDRTEPLVKKGVMSADDLDHATADFHTATHARENAVQMLALLQAGTRPEDLAVAKAAVELAKDRRTEAQAAVAQAQAGVVQAQAGVVQAQTAVVKAQRDLAHRTVTAPFDGWVARRWQDPGAIPMQGQPVLSLYDPATLRVDANVEEKYLGKVQVGDEVQVKVDAYPDLALTGSITKILRGTNAEFSLVPAEGVSGTFIKVAQRVQLRIAVSTPPELALGPGLSVTARIRIGSAKAQPMDTPDSTAIQAAFAPEAGQTAVAPTSTARVLTAGRQP